MKSAARRGAGLARCTPMHRRAFLLADKASSRADVSGEWRRRNFAFSHGRLARALLENHEPAFVLRRASAMLRTDRQQHAARARAHACVRAHGHTASDGWFLNIRTEYCCIPAYRQYVPRLLPVFLNWQPRRFLFTSDKSLSRRSHWTIRIQFKKHRGEAAGTHTGHTGTRILSGQ